MLSEECLASTAICTSRGDLDQTFFGKVWTLSKSHFVGLKSKRLDFLAIYLFGYIYIYDYICIYIRIFVEARYV